MAACDALWQPVPADWMPLKKPLQAGRPQIIRSSDAGIIEWSDLEDHQWSHLRSSAVWLCCQGLPGAERNNDEKNDWKKFPHARAWGSRRVLRTATLIGSSRLDFDIRWPEIAAETLQTGCSVRCDPDTPSFRLNRAMRTSSASYCKNYH